MAEIKEIMENLPNQFLKDKAKGWDRCIHFVLGGEQPCEYTAIIKAQTLTVREGAPTADEAAMKTLQVTGNSENIAKMFGGLEPPMKLVNAKLIQMKGSVIDSMSFSRIWNIEKKY